MFRVVAHDQLQMTHILISTSGQRFFFPHRCSRSRQHTCHPPVGTGKAPKSCPFWEEARASSREAGGHCPTQPPHQLKISHQELTASSFPRVCRSCHPSHAASCSRIYHCSPVVHSRGAASPLGSGTFDNVWRHVVDRTRGAASISWLEVRDAPNFLSCEIQSHHKSSSSKYLSYTQVRLWIFRLSQVPTTCFSPI